MFFFPALILCNPYKSSISHRLSLLFRAIQTLPAICLKTDYVLIPPFSPFIAILQVPCKWALDQHNWSNNKQTNMAGAHSSFPDVQIVSSSLCVVKSNMAATMWIHFVRKCFTCHSNNKIHSRFKESGVSSSIQHLNDAFFAFCLSKNARFLR